MMTEQRLQEMEHRLTLDVIQRHDLVALIAEVRRLQQDNTTLCLIVEGVNHDMTCDAAHPCLRCQRDAALAERDRFGANAENFRQSMYALESDLVSLAQERDALRDNLYPMTYQKAVMALAEARRVLRRCHEVLANQGYQLDDDDPESLCSQVAAVLAQEEPHG